MYRIMALLSIVVLLPGCDGSEESQGDVGTQIEIEVLADTTEIRNLGSSSSSTSGLIEELRLGAVSGDAEEVFGSVRGLAVSAAGDIYVFDRQVPALRWYRPNGTYAGTVGGEGSGPGEYLDSDGGLAVLDDGHVVLRDPGNGRYSVYDSLGAYVTSWPSRRNVSLGSPVSAGPSGSFFAQVGRPQSAPTDAPSGPYLARFDLNGAGPDTVLIPVSQVAALTLTAGNSAMQARLAVPFSPRTHWAVPPDGGVLVAEGGTYQVDWYRADGTVLRITRDTAPVAVSDDERDSVIRELRTSMRRLDPEWDAEIPIPDVKPFIRGLYAGRDGRTWVLTHRPGERRNQPSAAEPPISERPSMEEAQTIFDTRPEFEEPLVFDVFDRDGRYLGEVEAPDGFSLTPRPVFGAEHVWAVVLDELDVPFVVRYRIVLPEPEIG